MSMMRVKGRTISGPGFDAPIPVKDFMIGKTPFTNSHFRELIGQIPGELGKIFGDPHVQLRKSIGAAQYKDEASNCPLVFVDREQAKALAGLFGCRLPTEPEWICATYELRVSYPQTIRGQLFYTAPKDNAIDLYGCIWEWTSTVTHEHERPVACGGPWQYRSGAPNHVYSGDSKFFCNIAQQSKLGFRFAKDID